jgi:hypothetical protein
LAYEVGIKRAIATTPEASKRHIETPATHRDNRIGGLKAMLSFKVCSCGVRCSAGAGCSTQAIRRLDSNRQVAHAKHEPRARRCRYGNAHLRPRPQLGSCAAVSRQPWGPALRRSTVRCDRHQSRGAVFFCRGFANAPTGFAPGAMMSTRSVNAGVHHGTISRRRQPLCRDVDRGVDPGSCVCDAGLEPWQVAAVVGRRRACLPGLRNCAATGRYEPRATATC